MKKLLMFCTVLLSSLLIVSCSGGNKIPDDLVVILPDEQELYLYMPKDEAEAVLGEKFSGDDLIKYNFEELGISISFYNNVINKIRLNSETTCKLKSGVNVYYTKEEFINAGFFTENTRPVKFYSISNGNYELLEEKLELPTSYMPENFQKAACIGSSRSFRDGEGSDNEAFPFSIRDWYTG